VKWIRGDRDDGKDSIAVQIAPADHWPEMRLLILVVCLCVLQYSHIDCVFKSVFRRSLFSKSPILALVLVPQG